MAPFLLLGFLIAGVLRVFVPQAFLNKKLGGNNFKSVLYGALLGVPLPLCSCGVIPTGISLRNNGASDGATISFLISTPQTGVDSIFITWSMLGLPFALLRPFIAFITGIFGGAMVNFFNKKNNDEKIKVAKLNLNQQDKNQNFIEKIREMLRYSFVTFLDDIVKWLVIGLFLAALLNVMIPESFISKYIGNQWIEMTIALAVSVPLYICATGSVPLAAVLMLKGLSPGAALVLLMAGPATNVATITVVGKTLGTKNLMIYLSAIIIGAFFFGFITNAILPTNYIHTLGKINIDHVHGGGIFEWIKIISAIVLTILLLAGLYRKYFINHNISKSMEKIKGEHTVIVDGMTCHHCEGSVEKNLLAVENVIEVKADLNSCKVIIKGENVDFKKIKEVIDSIGYKFVKVEE